MPLTPAPPAPAPIRVLSLGAGVQSTVLLLMSIRGELPRIDHAVFSDTRYEPPAVYDHLEWLKGEAARAAVPLHIVSEGDLRRDAIMFRRYGSRAISTNRAGHASVPLFILNRDGSAGMVRRQCTSEYKIKPIERFIRRDLLGLAHGQRAPSHVVVEQWFGITWDESQRMRLSTDKWKRNVYPFCGTFGDDLLPKFWRRQDCVEWLHTNYPGRTFPRSACICCPYRSNAEWRQMRDADPTSWADAVDFDRQIRMADTAAQAGGLRRLVGLPFIHRDLKPLDEVDLRSDTDKGQGTLWENECEGMCGV